mmetsp:Transcript_125553/g.390871  ORF Transcript_125553/g.390871 Transcript_125553/m.390871 type:complete len:501 (-) Transcript_125553:105-1607(-)|eukprot:CAMPEP_0204578132 /NCGR_PEP_ID=MMETSP0661-20131031/42745_1 /ASSEMBLY_ACC=CAM_ASM_000606 /TAXON_ID=109239 /ORGANISM="Alexandrium margalefi, Strain AMGDE01CS-322" /LENGTH=500 /DNA_ID=CAMNT_0051587033 /DNA_START=51 /DNA_END=1553 /DNA_ORIENTATION=+
MDEKYQRIKVLGKGSFGKAYLVKNTEADELCVVKQMETSMMDPKERNEAVKEAMLLKRMDHKNIVRFQEVFMTRKGRLCIVMDYADGGDVHMEIKRREGKLIPESRILEWFVQTCFALKHVHDRKVLHRDLKTQNIFLMATGQIKLGDFGIARVLDATKDYAKTMVGTPYYLSPEIIEDRPYNFKSDVWSLGVVLYEMTTLKHPFDADSLVILASKILKDQYPPPDEMYTKDLVALVRCMLCKDAGMRPSLHRILENRFLHPAMQESNSKYNLGLDLSEFLDRQEPAEAPGPAKAPSAALDPKQAGGASLEHSQGAGDTVLMGSVRQPPQAPSPTAESCRPEEEEGDYEEEFEDYSGSEDGEADAQAELKQSVANLRLGGGAARAAPKQKLETVAEEDSSAATPSGTSRSLADGGGRIGAKADSLRSYLRSQMPESQFQRAYALVRASGETTTEALQQQVAEVIGAEKAPELFTLFQLLCFLEDVSANAQSASPAHAAAA